jgi:hypothetical protein
MSFSSPSDGQDALIVAARRRRESADAEHVAKAQHVLWFCGDRAYGREPGGFVSRLLLAMSAADNENFRRLAIGFPDYAELFDTVSRDDIDVVRRLVKGALA